MTPAELTDTHEEALDRLKASISATKLQYLQEIDDLAFQDPESQWPSDAVAARKAQTVAGIKIPAQPMLSVSTLDEPIQLILNQERSAHLGVQVHPLTEDATDDTATVLQGLYRTIERDSRASLARSWAFDRATKCGRGAYRILAEPDRNSPVKGDQKLVIKRILYQSSVYLDPFAQEPDWSDGEWAFIVEDMPFAKYKRRFSTSKLAKYSDQDLVSLGEQEIADAPDLEKPSWVGGDSPATRTVRVAEYFYLDIKTDRQKEKNWKGEDSEIEVEVSRTLYWCVINGIEIITEPQPQDAHYIPIIPMIGRELQPFDNRRRWVGMIHNAKDGARLTNYAASNAVKMAALEPQAPWQGYEGAFEGHEEEYRQSNVRAIPFLQSKRTGFDGQPIPLPIRVQADMSRLGPSMQLLSMGRDFVQAATSTFDPALGNHPETHRTSGRAIIALQDQTNVGTSNYVANEAEISLPYEALVVLDWIPFIYDRPGRIVQILDDNDKLSKVMLNQAHTIDPHTKQPIATPIPSTMDPAQVSADQRNPVKHYDLNKGRYGVSVTIGKSSTSRLQQGQDAIGQILQADPQLLPLIGPEYFKFLDFPGAPQIAKLLQKNRDHAMPWLADTDGQPDPKAQLQHAEAVMKQMNQQIQELTQQQQGKVVEQQGKAQIAQMQIQADNDNAAKDREVKLAVAELGAKVDRLALFMEERARVGDNAHQVGLAAMDQTHTLAQGEQAHQQDLVQAEQGQAHGLETQAAQPPPPPPDPTPESGA